MAMESKSNDSAAPLLWILGGSLVFQIYQLQGQPWALAFVVTTYTNLLLFFWCLAKLHGLPEGSGKRRPLRAVVWVLSSMLIVSVSYRVAVFVPLALRVLLWCVAGTTVSVTAYGFFVESEKSDAEAAAAAAALEP